MPFNSIEGIVKEFNLKTNKPEEIRKILRKKVLKIHPDKTTGGKEFKNKKDEKKYYEILDALNFIDNKSNGDKALVEVPTQQLTDLVKKITDLGLKENQTDINKELNQQIDRNINHIKISYRTPKIGLTTITGILTFLWLFPTTIQEHPILGEIYLFYYRIFESIWFCSLTFTIIIWIITWIRENEFKDKISRLTVESYQNRVVENFIDRRGFRTGKFSKEDFIDYLINTFNYRYTNYHTVIGIRQFIQLINRIPIIRKPTISLVTAQQVADSIFIRLENKNIIKKVDSQKLKEYYTINNDK